jgi:tetratricopeptide (TPR) repeat protein
VSVVDTAKKLLAQGRVADALAVIRPAADQPNAAEDVLKTCADALKALDRLPEAVGYARRAVFAAPWSLAAKHNLAAVLGDLGMHAESRKIALQAMRMGLKAPETRLVLARADLGLGRLDDAEVGFREALRLRPGWYDAHRDLAQLIWMRTGDAAAALDAVRQALVTAPAPELVAIEALVLDRAGETEAALKKLRSALARWPADVRLLGAAASYAGDLGLGDEALALASAAWRAAPGTEFTGATLGVALLGVGRARDAFDLSLAWRASAPYAQSAIALQAVAARLLGRPEHRILYDYDAFVRAVRIEAPEGWPSLEAFLAELASTLERLHAFSAHPLENSLRGGSQTAADLTRSEEPAIRAFFRAIDRPIRDYMAAIGTGEDPLRSRNTGEYAFRGAWSVRLRSGGSHVDHVHPQGWLSSAFYVKTPAAALGRPGREGWLRFGKPRYLVRPALDAESWVQPEPGLLVLFPSYMLHGTEPFSTDEQRLTIAFDLVPA